MTGNYLKRFWKAGSGCRSLLSSEKSYIGAESLVTLVLGISTLPTCPEALFRAVLFQYIGNPNLGYIYLDNSGWECKSQKLKPCCPDRMNYPGLEQSHSCTNAHTCLLKAQDLNYCQNPCNGKPQKTLVHQIYIISSWNITTQILSPHEYCHHTNIVSPIAQTLSICWQPAH